MQQENDDLQSLIDTNERKLYKNSKPSFFIYSSKNKNLDLYQSLLNSTNYPGFLFSDHNQMQDDASQALDIELLQYEPSVKRKKGRPKKSEIIQKKEQDYSVNQQEEQGPYIPLNKKKKKKIKRLVKGQTKNIFQFFSRLVISYLQKYSNKEQNNNTLKFKPNRCFLYQLIKNKQFEQTLHNMFETRFLNRQIVASSRLSVKNKILYLKKVQILEQIFINKNSVFEEELHQS